MRSLSHFRRCAADERGATIVEFAFVAPILCMLLIGGMDIGHTLYMRAALEGIVQDASRSSALESGTSAVNQEAIDTAVRRQVHNLHRSANVAITREAFASYGQAQRRGEEFTDSNGDGFCNNGEPFIDENNNSTRDANLGRTGQGTAKDAVIYRVAVSYPALPPLWHMLGRSNQVEVTATTVLRNQPYGEQPAFVPTQRNCT